MLRVGVSGVAGKMGREIVAAMRDYKETKLTAALESPDSPHLGEELSGVPISGSFVAGAADVFIDFSVPAGRQIWRRSVVPLKRRWSLARPVSPKTKRRRCRRRRRTLRLSCRRI